MDRSQLPKGYTGFVIIQYDSGRERDGFYRWPRLNIVEEGKDGFGIVFFGPPGGNNFSLIPRDPKSSAERFALEGLTTRLTQAEEEWTDSRYARVARMIERDRL